MLWTELNDAPVNELFKGIRIRPLFQEQGIIKAMVVEFDPGSCWEGGDDVHDKKFTLLPESLTMDNVIIPLELLFTCLKVHPIFLNQKPAVPYSSFIRKVGL